MKPEIPAKGANMGYILGLGGPYEKDSSACLLDEDTGIVAFLEEERLTRRKRNSGSRSATRSAVYCLAQAGISLNDIDYVAVGWNRRWPAEAKPLTEDSVVRGLLDPHYFKGITPAQVEVVDHHRAHAASAFYCSGFGSAAVLVVDGSGDGVATTLYHGTPNGLVKLAEYPFTQSLGFFYESAAAHIGLGAAVGAPKMMGLAAYGTPRYELDFLTVTDEGYAIDLSRYGLAPDDTGNFDYVDFSWLTRLRQTYSSAYSKLGVQRNDGRMSYQADSGAFRREPDFTTEQADLAATMQHALEGCLTSLARRALRLTGESRLCLAGGVALNCSANGVIQRESGAQQIYVQPVAGDAGIAIGSALEVAAERRTLKPATVRMTHTALGPGFSDDTIKQTLDSWRIPYTYHGDKVSTAAARALAAGSIVGWFQGRTEGGPRALGHRSILGDPRSIATRDRINRVKGREWWRPLAPSVLDTIAPDLIESPGGTEFMVIAHQATDRARTEIPATVHVDGSMRPQVVSPQEDPRYASLLAEFGERSGVAALLNTSFNNESEPIVCSPRDALRTFWSSGLDALAIGGFLVEKARHDD